MHSDSGPSAHLQYSTTTSRGHAGLVHPPEGVLSASATIQKGMAKFDSTYISSCLLPCWMAGSTRVLQSTAAVPAQGISQRNVLAPRGKFDPMLLIVTWLTDFTPDTNTSHQANGSVRNGGVVLSNSILQVANEPMVSNINEYSLHS